MSLASQTRADGRALLSAAFVGSSLGLVLGVTYLNAGLARYAAADAEAVRMADAAGRAGAPSVLGRDGRGLRLALSQYSFSGRADAAAARQRVQLAAAARHRADLDCLTEAVYYEARSETPTGQAAVAQVVLNRVKHPAFPKSVCSVVFQGAGRAGCQFSFTCDGSIRAPREAAAWDRARSIAVRVLAGRLTGPIGAATHYHTTAVSPGWAPQMRRVAQVGAHVFYRISPERLRLAALPAPAPERAVLTKASAPAAIPELRLSASMEKAIETSLEPVSAEPAKVGG